MHSLASLGAIAWAVERDRRRAGVGKYIGPTLGDAYDDEINKKLAQQYGGSASDYAGDSGGDSVWRFLSGGGSSGPSQAPSSGPSWGDSVSNWAKSLIGAGVQAGTKAINPPPPKLLRPGFFSTPAGTAVTIGGVALGVYLIFRLLRRRS